MLTVAQLTPSNRSTSAQFSPLGLLSGFQPPMTQIVPPTTPEASTSRGRAIVGPWVNVPEAGWYTPTASVAPAIPSVQLTSGW